MKSSPAETTELVADPVGRFMVRKTIARDAGIGRAYEQLKNAWDEGVQLAHLPRVYAFFRTEDAVVVLMEHLQGVDLWKRLDLEGCGVEAARRYFPELCEAVRELHERFDPPIIHRDLKPSNVLIMPDGCVKVLDFGISREFRQGAEADTRFLGTREYAPPEQFGFKQTDVRSDVYSLGMMLYHILTGQTPNASLHTEGFADPDVPAALRPVLMRATEFDPDRRYGSVAELQEAFEAALSGNPLPKPAALTVAGGALAEIDPEAQLENSAFIAVIRDVERPRHGGGLGVSRRRTAVRVRHLPAHAADRLLGFFEAADEARLPVSGAPDPQTGDPVRHPVRGGHIRLLLRCAADRHVLSGVSHFPRQNELFAPSKRLLRTCSTIRTL